MSGADHRLRLLRTAARRRGLSLSTAPACRHPEVSPRTRPVGPVRVLVETCEACKCSRVVRKYWRQRKTSERGATAVAGIAADPTGWQRVSRRFRTSAFRAARDGPLNPSGHPSYARILNPPFVSVTNSVPSDAANTSVDCTTRSAPGLISTMRSGGPGM
jgi:hypothetical protein